MPLVDDTRKAKIARRDLFRVVASVGAVAAVVSSVAPGASEPPPKRDRGKSKSQYQANAPEVQTFYRVNRYPTK